VRLVAKQFVTYEANITQGGLVIRHSEKPLEMNSGGFDLRHVAAIKQLFETYVYAVSKSIPAWQAAEVAQRSEATNDK
jgi:hypothetical protein